MDVIEVCAIFKNVLYNGLSDPASFSRGKKKGGTGSAKKIVLENMELPRDNCQM